MREHLSKIVIVALLVVVVGVPFLLQPAATDVADAGPRDRLIVFTPHNEQIRYEFGRAFNAWRIEQGDPAVDFDWRALGGTSDLRKLVLSQFEAAAREQREDDGIGADLFFGGGEFEHNMLARGVTVERNGEEVRIPVIVPPELPEALFAEAFPEPTIGGERLYHPERYWVGVVLASFGIVYNRDVLGILDIDEPPMTWSDLRDPRYRGWVALADPGHSGSIAATYNVILRRTGWNEGWRLLREVFANARYFTNSAGKVPVDVSAGEAAAGMCIDFYGRFQAGAIGGNRVGYVDPMQRTASGEWVSLTATTADPISLLRGAPHRDLAEQFIAWLLTPEAQGLWQKRIGTPGGPERFELRRQPIRRDLYVPAQRTLWADPEIDPFPTAKPIPAGVPDYYRMVAPVSSAMAIDVHADLVAAWEAIQATPREDPRRAEMLELFYAMPPALRLEWPDAELARSWEAALADPSHPRHDDAVRVLDAFGEHLASRYYGSAKADRLQRDRVAWTLFFREQYREVVRIARR